MFKLIRQSVLSTLCLAVLLCAAYPMLVTGAADAFFPKEAAGSLILRDGAIVGSALIGQPFSSAKYFHPRPSAAGYNAGGLSPEAVEKLVRGHVEGPEWGVWGEPKVNVLRLNLALDELR